jgi:hypothetical protein
VKILLSKIISCEQLVFWLECIFIMLWGWLRKIFTLSKPRSC